MCLHEHVLAKSWPRKSDTASLHVYAFYDQHARLHAHISAQACEEIHKHAHKHTRACSCYIIDELEMDSTCALPTSTFKVAGPLGSLRAVGPGNFPSPHSCPCTAQPSIRAHTALHCTALHCTALHCTALHCTAHTQPCTAQPSIRAHTRTHARIHTHAHTHMRACARTSSSLDELSSSSSSFSTSCLATCAQSAEAGGGSRQREWCC